MPKKLIALTLTSGLLLLSATAVLAEDTTTIQNRPTNGKANQSRGIGQQVSDEKIMEVMENNKEKRMDLLS